MKPMTAASGVKLPREENRGRLLNRHVFSQPLVLGLEPLDLRRFVTDETLAATGVDVCASPTCAGSHA